jgi:hypothetical protein
VRQAAANAGLRVGEDDELLVADLLAAQRCAEHGFVEALGAGEIERGDFEPGGGVHRESFAGSEVRPRS